MYDDNGWVVYNVDTHRMYTYHKTRAGASRSLTARLKRHSQQHLWEFPERPINAAFHLNASITTYAEWNAADTEVEVINLMSGKPVKIRKSERGGCCDPSTELYWSM